MEELLRDHMARFIRLSDAEFDQFYQCLRFRQLKRREVLMSIGDICRDAYFIQQGCLRYFHVVDGEEITGQFFFEHSWYSDYESFLLEQPSEQGIQALESSQIALLSKSSLLQLYTELPQFERFGRLMAESAFIGLRKRTETLTHLTPEDRYLRLLQHRPKVIERVPQHFIASYLGIKPQSLSRIRKRISSEL